MIKLGQQVKLYVDGFNPFIQMLKARIPAPLGAG
jgi:hypothetical protein